MKTLKAGGRLQALSRLTMKPSAHRHLNTTMSINKQARHRRWDTAHPRGRAWHERAMGLGVGDRLRDRRGSRPPTHEYRL